MTARFWLPVFLVFTYLFGCQPPEPAKQPQPHEIIAKSLDSTVILLNVDQERVLCAGQFVAPYWILTAQHCIPNATGCEDEDGLCQVGGTVPYVSRASYETAGTKVSYGKVKAIDPEADIALIVTPELSTVWTNVGFGAVEKGEAVYMIGHPLGIPYVITQGFITSTSDHYIRASIAINYGNSGGGLYDMQGNLLGVTSQMVNAGTVGFFAPISAVMRLVACQTGICSDPAKAAVKLRRL